MNAVGERIPAMLQSLARRVAKHRWLAEAAARLQLCPWGSCNRAVLLELSFVEPL